MQLRGACWHPTNWAVRLSFAAHRLTFGSRLRESTMLQGPVAIAKKLSRPKPRGTAIIDG